MTSLLHNWKRYILETEGSSRNVQGRREFNRYLLLNKTLGGGGKKRKKQQNIDIQSYRNGLNSNDNDAYNQWTAGHVVLFDVKKRTDPDSLLLVWIAIKDVDRTIHAVQDGDGDRWGRSVKMTGANSGTTWYEGTSPQTILIKRKKKKKKKKKAVQKVKLNETIKLQYKNQLVSFVVHAIPRKFKYNKLNLQWNYPAFFTPNPPTLLVSDLDWAWLKNGKSVHSGAFGDEFEILAHGDFTFNGHGKWVRIYKFPYDLNNKIKFKPLADMFLPVGKYSMTVDNEFVRPWSMKTSYIGKVATKYRKKLPRGAVHKLVMNDNMSFAMISSTYYIDGWWETDQSQFTNVNAVIQQLYKQNIYAFSCYGQHHALVFYYDKNNNKYITPEHLATLLRNPLIVRILSSYADSDRITQWSKNYIQTFGVKQFSLSTYNILYSNASNVLSPWEIELIHKSNNAVRERDLYWNVRKPRLLANLKKDHQDLPDIILFQEMTPSMWSSLNLTQYDGIHSKKGCCEFEDGFAWVCWKKDKFNLQREYHTTMCRWVGARLEFEGKDIIVSSVHLPSNPSSSTFSKGIQDIQRILASESCPIVLGGDFNVTYNPMDGFDNISGDAPTFNNDSVYKLDWIVGKGIKFSDVEVNSIKSDSKWPNRNEGSDHTNIRINIIL